MTGTHRQREKELETEMEKEEEGKNWKTEKEVGQKETHLLSSGVIMRLAVRACVNDRYTVH